MQINYKLLAVFVLFVLSLFSFSFVLATPVGPVIVSNSTETYTAASAAMINTSGGSITTMVLNATTQNLRWKAFVGNVTGKLTLDDAQNNSIFDWSLSSMQGEIYATRSTSSITWTNLNCSNMTHIVNEEIAMNHTTNPDDNISATFETKDHDSFYVGTEQITANTCYSVHTYVNDTNQSDYVEEVLMYDGTTDDNGNMVYASILESDVSGFDNNTYDFQMIVPENGLTTWNGATAYYFYVELT